MQAAVLVQYFFSAGGAPASNLELIQIFGAAVAATAPSGTPYVVSPIVASPDATAVVT